MYDRFYDEDSKCPKCKARVKADWVTKQFECLLESWQKGDFVQYRKLEEIPEEERKGKYWDMKFVPRLRKTSKYLSNVPLLFNGKVPVSAICNKCDAWLEAHAKVVAGRFTGIVEIEANGEEKEFVIIRPEATAKSLRKEFESRLSHLQQSCKHEKAKWIDMEWPLGPIYGQRRVCLKCEKTLETRNNLDPAKPNAKKSYFKVARGIGPFKVEEEMKGHE